MNDRPLTEPAFLVLTALARAPQHGYGIVGEVAELSQGRLQLKIGTLYGVLDRLVGERLVELDREEVQQGRLRRYYRLTRDGGAALAAEAKHLAANARVATDRLSVWQAAAPEGSRRPSSEGRLA
jgi:PadR family transcriptional regulator, regulatory protein PadR